MKKDRLIYLTGKELTDVLSSSEAEELENLLAENKEFQKLNSQLKKDWETAGRYKLSMESNVEDSWKKLQQRIQVKPQNRVLFLHPIVRVAAVILLTIGIGWFVLNPFGNIKYETGVGEELVVQLSDNSVITLNESSFLKVNHNFGDKTRQVEFRGEAYFDISKNPEKAFIINTRNSQIEVLGTSFNVDAKDGEIVQVDVTSGRVSLSELGKKEHGIILTKGMSGFFNSINSSLVSSEYVNQNFQAWRTNTLEFNDISMDKVIDDLSEYFKIEIESENEAILSCNLTSSFTNPTLDEVLGVISVTLDLTIQKNGQMYQLEGKGCTEN